MSRRPHKFISTQWLVIMTLLVGVTVFLVYSDWLWRWDKTLYDFQMPLWSEPPPEDIIIVAIDDLSLSELGRWPWSRAVHAELIRRLTAAGARAVLVDILFTEPDDTDPRSDEQLVSAVSENGKVVLPMVVEEIRQGGQLLEKLPIPSLGEAAAAIGHIHIDLDPDGIARRLHLLEGIGTAYWPNISLALFSLLNPDEEPRLPGTRNPNRQSGFRHTIVRDHQILIPYGGSPGHFKSIPYVRVLKSEFLEDTFRDRIVLVGVTATGLGDALPTPVSGLDRPMPGIEIIGHVIEALRKRITIKPLDVHWRMLLAGAILVGLLLLYPRMTPRYVFLGTAALLAATLALCIVLLRGFQIWFPPVPLMTGLVLSYPLWSWMRLERTVRYFSQELERLRAEPKSVAFYGESMKISKSLDFLRHVVPFDTWVLRDASGGFIAGDQEFSAGPSGNERDGWIPEGDSRWRTIERTQGSWLLGLKLADTEAFSEQAKQLLEELISQLASDPLPRPRNAVELIENQIQEIQSAVAELRTMRGFVSDTLNQMSDGLLVVNPSGQIVFANDQARSYLKIVNEEKSEIEDLDVMTLAGRIAVPALNWTAALRRVLIEREKAVLEGRFSRGKELLIQMSPLLISRGRLHGMILILADISLLKESQRKRAEALSFLSHDLRSPLTSLLSLLQMRHQQHTPADQEGLSQRIEDYAARALKLAEGFLQLAKAENADQVDFAETDFVTVVHNAVDEAYTGARLKGIRLVRRIDSDEIWLHADAELLERALSNLLENAIRYSPNGSLVELELAAGTNEIACCVQDQGTGIAEPDLTRIFDAFRRGAHSEPGKQKGTGLGLAFVKVVAEKHGGSIEVESKLGQGSRFCLRLPVGNSAGNQK